MLLPSSHRPIPLACRPDLLVSAVASRDEEYVLIQDPLTLVNFQLPVLQYQILASLDGNRSLDEVIAQIKQAGVSTAISPHDVFRLIIDLAKKRLIWNRRSGTVDAMLSDSDREGWRRFGATLRNPFFIQCPGVYPGKILMIAAGSLGWIYSIPVVLCVSLFVLLTWACLLLYADAFVREFATAQLFMPGHGIWKLWVVVGLLKVLHELSHGLACEKFGARCQSIGLAFLFFSPCMYCDVSNSWRLEKKGRRIAISLAGVYVELFLSALGFWCWRFSSQGLLHQVSLQVFVAGSFATLLFNANPLLKFDGYYVLSDWLEIPNLYQRSRHAVRRMMTRIFLGVRTPDDHSTLHGPSQPLLISYGLASMAYQIPMVIGVWLLFLHFFESYGLSAIPFAYVVVSVLLLTHRVVTWGFQSNDSHRSARPSRVNTTMTVVGLFGSLSGLWMCPLSGSMTAPVVIDLESAVPVYVETPGTVREVCVTEGDVIHEETSLVRLEDPVLDRRLTDLEGLLRAHDIDILMAQSMSDPDLMTLAQTAKESVAEQLDHARQEKERLHLRAPVSGTVISAGESRPRFAQARVNSKDSSTQLLNSQLVGAYLERRTCLCQISPNSRWHAMIWVDQRQRQFLSTGQSVTVRLDAVPGTDLPGKIQSVGVANEATVPAVLSTNFGGQWLTQSSEAGEVPVEPVYRATILLDPFDGPAQPGMRGVGRFSRPPTTVGAWVIDEIHRVFAAR